MKFGMSLKVKVSVFFHYLPLVFKRELKFNEFKIFLKRILLFLSRLENNKSWKMKNGMRLALYVPSFGTPAFFTACDKFKVFNQKMPCTGVLISVTRACAYQCEHCYQKHDKGEDTPIELLIDTVQKLQNMGIAFFNIEGGEPFLLFDRLKAVCDVIDDRSEAWINTTGYGLTKEKLRGLKCTGIMFSLHSPNPEKFNQFMGREDAWDTMQNGISLCREAGIPVGLNVCLQKEAFYDGTFEKVMNLAKKEEVCMVQVIKPKPAGGWLGQEEIFFSEEDISKVKEKVMLYNTDKKYTAYPPVYAQVIEEDPSMFGCTAGGTDRFYINAKGDIQPCEFLNISFGNIKEEPFEDIYNKMRAYFDKPASCLLCEVNAGKIHKLFTERNVSTLPLTGDLSKAIYQNWDRGEYTEFYQKLDECS